MQINRIKLKNSKTFFVKLTICKLQFVNDLFFQKKKNDLFRSDF